MRASALLRICARDLQRHLREWAKAKRKAHFSGVTSSDERVADARFHELLGARSMFHSALCCGRSASPRGQALYERACARTKRILHAEILRRPDERPAFFVQRSDDRTLPPVPLVVIVVANREDKDFCRWAKEARPGETYDVGGGAAPHVQIERIAR